MRLLGDMDWMGLFKKKHAAGGEPEGEPGLRSALAEGRQAAKDARGAPTDAALARLVLTGVSARATSRGRTLAS